MYRTRSLSHFSTAASPPMADLCIKFSRIASHHEQLKIAFLNLNSQIRTGLLEADDVFASLAIPLMKLVGLKTVEMTEEGRFSSIIINNKNSNYPDSEDWLRNESRSEETLRGLVTVSEGADENHRTTNLEEENTMARAINAGKELMEKQKLQFMQLMHLLKHIEIQVNSSQDDILQTVADHRTSIQKLFHQAVKLVYAYHQSCQTNGMSLLTLKLLKATFDHACSALSSVEMGVEDMIGKLADKMCSPMVRYVNDLKSEIIAGVCPSLLAIVEEMGGTMRLRRLELEEARKKARAAETSRLDMITKLKESEERMKRMKEDQGFHLEDNNQGFLQEANKCSRQSNKLLDIKEEQSIDETLLWELLRKKRRLQTPDSPFGAKELLGIGTTVRNLRSARVRPSVSCKSISRNQLARTSQQTPSMDFWLPLGSSPSTTARQGLPRKHITP